MAEVELRNNTDPRVDVYLEALPEWQQAICRKVRDLAHAADPELVETIKRKRQPYFVLKGNVCALLAAKNWVNVFLYDGAIVPAPQGADTTTRPWNLATFQSLGRPVGTYQLKYFSQFPAHF